LASLSSGRIVFLCVVADSAEQSVGIQVGPIIDSDIAGWEILKQDPLILIERHSESDAFYFIGERRANESLELDGVGGSYGCVPRVQKQRRGRLREMHGLAGAVPVHCADGVINGVGPSRPDD
jgi:hypothetical protein